MSSQANASSDIERAEHLNYADSKGVKRVSIFNDGVQVNAATETTLQSIDGKDFATAANQTDGSQKTQIVGPAGDNTDYNINNVDDDGNDANANYYGFESSSGAWYIMKEDKSSNPTVYTYAKGASGYAAAWTARASQSYAIYGTTF